MRKKTYPRRFIIHLSSLEYDGSSIVLTTSLVLTSVILTTTLQVGIVWPPLYRWGNCLREPKVAEPARTQNQESESRTSILYLCALLLHARFTRWSWAFVSRRGELAVQDIHHGSGESTERGGQRILKAHLHPSKLCFSFLNDLDSEKCSFSWRYSSSLKRSQNLLTWAYGQSAYFGSKDMQTKACCCHLPLPVV